MHKFIFFIFVCLTLTLVFSPLMIKSLNLNLSEPINGTYRSDELSFLKTFYLIEQGRDYYSSFKLAREDLTGGIKLEADTFTWRSPVIFLIWSTIANDGTQIFNLFVFLSLLALGCSFLMLKKLSDARIASISTFFLALYLIDTLFYKTAFLFTEWWGVLFIIFAFTALIYKYKLVATLLFTLAVLTREIFVIPILVLLVWEVILKRKAFWIYLIPVLIFGLFYIIHSYSITTVLQKSSEFTLLERFHFFEWTNLQRMLSFSMRKLVVFNLKTHYLIFLLGIISPFVYLLFEYKNKKEVISILLFVLTLVLLFPLISVYDNDYWGIMFMPMIIILSPFFLSLFKSRID